MSAAKDGLGRVRADEWDEHGPVEEEVRAADLWRATGVGLCVVWGVSLCLVVGWVVRITVDPAPGDPPGFVRLLLTPVALLCVGFTVWLAGGGIKPGIVHGETDDYSYNIVKDPVSLYDLNATILHCLGIDHSRFTFKSQGLDQRLTGVEPAEVVKAILA